MKLRIVIISFLTVVLFYSTASAAIYATDVFYSRGKNLLENSLRSNPLNALGSYTVPALDKTGTVRGGNIDFLSLGLGGEAILSFGGRQFSGDITIYETTWNRPNGYNEYATVWGGNDVNSDSWEYLGELYNQEVDTLGAKILSTDDVFSFIKIVDTTLKNNGARGDGFDINAVSVSPTPIPAAVWLLGSGLLGLAAIRRKSP